MADIVSRETRSRMMSGIRGKNTKPELIVRRGLHRQGLRYRLHDRNLPGKPDIVFSSRKCVIFVHGCFWHGHHCHLFRLPTTRPEFWSIKIKRNREIDTQAMFALQEQGWRCLIIWECALKGRTKLSFDKVISIAVRWVLSSRKNKEIAGGI